MSAKTYAEVRKEREQYVDEIKRYEEIAKRSPAAYKARIVWFTRLGYAFVILLLLFTLALLGGIVWITVTGHVYGGLIKLGLFAVLLLVVILRSLFIRLRDPEGVELSRAEAPKLFAMIDELCEKLNVKQIHKVVVTDDYNAAAAQKPMFGMIGPTRNTLILGFPYLVATSTPELRATIAHEFGHFAGGHSAFGAKIYRLTATWMTLSHQLNSGGGANIIRSFLNWYMPKLDGMTFALRRANEYEADDASVRVGEGDSNALDLMRFGIQGRYYATEFWEEIDAMVVESPNPPRNLMHLMIERLNVPVPFEKAEKWLKESFERPTSYDDTHPSLTDRLTAFELLPNLNDEEEWAAVVDRVRTPPAISSGEDLLGHTFGRVAVELSERWYKTAFPIWQRQHEARKQVATELESITPVEGNEVQALLKKAELMSSLNKEKEELAICQEILRLQPDDPYANFVVGIANLRSGNPDFEEHLQRSAKDLRYRLAVPQVLFQHFESKNDHARAEIYYKQAQQADLDRAKLNAELTHLHEGPLLPVDLTPERRDRLISILQANDRVKTALAAKRPTSFDKDYELLIVIPKPKFTGETEEDIDRLANELNEQISDFSVMVIPKGYGKMVKRVGSLGHLVVYSRK